MVIITNQNIVNIGVIIMKKKIAILLVTGLVFAGTLSAQTMNRQPQPQVQPQEISTISGKLALVNGAIAVQNGNQTYYVHGFQHLIGFIDGLKEGATVTLEGYGFPIPEAPEYQHFFSTKLTFNGKTYELKAPHNRGGMMPHGNMAPQKNHMGPPPAMDRGRR